MPTASSPATRNQVVPLKPVERDTIPRIFLRSTDGHEREEALRWKEGGVWRALTRREVEERVTRLAAALAAWGVAPGDRVALLSENRPEWALVDYAVLGIGAVVVPVYATLPAGQVAYILENCGARVVFASTAEQLAKVAEVRAGLPALERVVAFDDPGVAAGVARFRDVLEAGGAAVERGDVGSFREAALRVARDDVATLIYTSGTTGDPKGVMLTHYNLASNVARARVVDARLAGREPSGTLALQNRLADRLVFLKLRERTGGRLETFVSGGAPLSADVARFFHAAGIPVYEGYGLSETSPVIAVNRPGHVRLGTVGQVVPGVEVRIGDEGEILTRGPHVMKGYWNDPEATARAIDGDGWFHTGDVGKLDADGFLRITDRLKDIIVTAGGKNVAPQPIENAAAMSPFVAQAVMIGDRRPYPVLLLVPDWENLGAWAGRHGIAASDRAALAADPRVHGLLEHDALRRLEDFARYEVPKKVAVIPEELTIESGALPPTLKVKRRVVEARYRDRIEALYADGVRAAAD